ncbi:hypothetical protein O3G_MSEX008879 [Manduca sexta]|nr:hypothetical protein O3G_MSEX008879 [Manduca sexta]
MLVAEHYKPHEEISYGLLQPGGKYVKLSTLASVKYTVWTAQLSDEGIPYKWTKATNVPLYKGPSSIHKNYDIKVTFNGNFSNVFTNVINAIFTWDSFGDDDLCFEIVHFCREIPLYNEYIWPTTKPNVTIENLNLDEECELTVMGAYGNTKFQYETPSCAEHKECVLNNLKPQEPKNVSLHAKEDSKGTWSVRVNWTQPRLLPERYKVTIRTAVLERSVSAPKNATEVVFNDIVAVGPYYNISIYAIIGERRKHTYRRGIFPGAFPWGWAAAAGASCALAAAATLAAALRCRRKGTSAHLFMKAENKSLKEEEAEEIDIESGSEDQWEVRSDRVLLHEVIGEGAFGVVRRGTLAPNGREVAVKMLKDFPSREEIRSFRAEMELMKSVGAHPHVVSLLGCCSTRARRPLIVAEYCSRGDLLTYLRCSWDVMVSKRNAKYYNNNTDSTDYRNDLFKCKLQKETKLVINKLYDLQGICDLELTPLDLLSFCRQIAMGMEFLSSNRVVHRDLAARNILVTGDRTLKIADFGLSRDIYEENQYKQKGNGKMPVKWMALESLTRRIYTTQSDVWSFGVVIWEIVTVGGSPYPEVPVARLVRLLRAGYRMPKPINCNKQLYDLMTWCWRAHPRERPNFTELHARLDELLNSASANQYITLELDDEPPPTPSPQRYIKMLIRGKRPWTRGESYERPLNTTCNHYTSLPVAATKTQS